MTFDPFGDFETRGYLRIFEQEKDVAIVRRLEHASFITGIDEAFTILARRGELTYGRTRRRRLTKIDFWSCWMRTTIFASDASMLGGSF